jgi:hypothetical protein
VKIYQFLFSLNYKLILAVKGREKDIYIYIYVDSVFQFDHQIIQIPFRCGEAYSSTMQFGFEKQYILISASLTFVSFSNSKHKPWNI